MKLWVPNCQQAGLVMFLSIVTAFGCSSPGGGGAADTGSDGFGVDTGYSDTSSPDTSSPDGSSNDISTIDYGQGNIVISNFQATENPNNILSFYVDWRTDQATESWLDVTCGDYYNESFTANGTQTQHSAFVMGLRADTSCTMVAKAVDAQDGMTTSSINVTVSSLPTWLPAPTATYSDASQIQAGWTLTNLHNETLHLPPSVVMFDRDGEIRWYYRASSVDFSIDNDVRTVSEGIMMQVPSQIVDYEGDIVWQQDLPVHHDLRPYGNDGHVLFLSHTECGAGQPGADLVVEFDRNTSQRVWEWSICENYTPPDVYPDWSHLNTIEPFPGEDALLVSSRHQIAVFKVDIDTGDVVWRLGFQGDFDMAQSDLFYNNHAPEIIESSGNILLFDNGGDQRRYSRAIEIAYTDTGAESSWEAEVVWEYTPSPNIFCFSWGDADRLQNDNRLITFGVQNPGDGNSHLIEVTSATPAVEVWDLEFPNGWSMYRAERVVSPETGYIVTD